MLRLVEKYVSFQGEGPNTGQPTTFVRFAGCNFKCAGWPCDTQHAIDPKVFTKIQRPVGPSILAQEVTDMGIQNVCITGGEPFLQNLDDLVQFAQELKERNHTIEVFTNGSLKWPASILDFIDTFILDWKLPGSGEFPDEDTLKDNLATLCDQDAIKFTIKDYVDFERAIENCTSVMPIWHENGSAPVVYCGPVWGCLTPEDIADWILEKNLPWRLNIQIHKYIWDPNKRGV